MVRELVYASLSLLCGTYESLFSVLRATLYRTRTISRHYTLSPFYFILYFCVPDNSTVSVVCVGCVAFSRQWMQKHTCLVGWFDRAQTVSAGILSSISEYLQLNLAECEISI